MHRPSLHKIHHLLHLQHPLASICTQYNLTGFTSQLGPDVYCCPAPSGSSCCITCTALQAHMQLWLCCCGQVLLKGIPDSVLRQWPTSFMRV